MNQGNILEKMVDAGITNETFSAEDVMERMMKKKSMVLRIGKSFVIYDPNGRIMEHTAAGFKKEGYQVKVLDLVQMKEENHYNPLYYCRNEAEAMSYARYLINKLGNNNEETFMTRAEIALLTALLCYIKMERSKKEQNFASIMKMLHAQMNDIDMNTYHYLDDLFFNLEKKSMDHIAVKQWKVFQVNHWKDQRRILASLAAKLSIFALPMIEQLTSTDDLELNQMKDQTTVLFVKIPTFNDSYDILTELLCFQLMNMKDCDHVSGWTEYQKKESPKKERHESKAIETPRTVDKASQIIKSTADNSIWDFV